jgi:hypothetical protein
MRPSVPTTLVSPDTTQPCNTSAALAGWYAPPRTSLASRYDANAETRRIPGLADERPRRGAVHGECPRSGLSGVAVRDGAAGRGLGDEQVRAALVALGHRAACLLEGGPLPITAPMSGRDTILPRSEK